MKLILDIYDIYSLKIVKFNILFYRLWLIGNDDISYICFLIFNCFIT